MRNIAIGALGLSALLASGVDAQTLLPSTVIVRSGDTIAPGDGGGAILRITQAPFVTASGQVAVVAETSAGPAAFLASADQGLRRLLGAGDPLPGAPTQQVVNLTATSLGDGGFIALTLHTPGVTTRHVVLDPQGNVVRTVLSTATIPGLSPSRTVGETPMRMVGDRSYFHHSLGNALVEWSGSGLQVLAGPNSPVADTDNWTLSRVNAVWADGAGRFYLDANIPAHSLSATTALLHEGVIRHAAPGSNMQPNGSAMPAGVATHSQSSVRLLADGQWMTIVDAFDHVLPIGRVNFDEGAHRRPVVTPDGGVYFTGTVADRVSGDTHALLVWPGSGMAHTLLRGNEPAPGLPDGWVIDSGYPAPHTFSHLLANSLGHIAFTAKVLTPGGEEQTALYLYDAATGFVPAAYTGGLLQVAPGDLRVVEELAIALPGGTWDQTLGFSDAGLVFTATFTDGSSAVFLTAIPEPAALGLLACASLLLSRRRRA